MESSLRVQLLEYEEDFGFEVLAEILSTYVEESPQILEKLKSELSKNDLESAVRSAHSLKGSSGYLGITGVREIASKIEKASEDGDIAMCQATLPELEAEIKKSVTIFQDILQAGCIPQTNPA